MITQYAVYVRAGKMYRWNLLRNPLGSRMRAVEIAESYSGFQSAVIEITAANYVTVLQLTPFSARYLDNIGKVIARFPEKSNNA